MNLLTRLITYLLIFSFLFPNHIACAYWILEEETIPAKRMMGITRAGMAAVNTGMDPLAMLKDVTSKAALKSYVIEGLAALTIHGISTEFGIPMTSVADPTKKAVEMSTLTTFSEHLQAQLLRNVVRTPLNIAIGGQDAGDALKNAIRSIAANTVGGFSANIIGADYREGITDMVTHQVLHALNGAVIGGILGGKDGLLPGVIGSTMAELMPKLMRLDLPDIERRLKAGEDLKVLQDEISKAADMGRLGGAIINTLLQENVDIGIQAGTIAAENNLIPAVAWLAAKITWEMYALMFPEDIERAKGMLCNYIAEHTGLPVEKVNLLADLVINASSLVKAARTGVKEGKKYVAKKTGGFVTQEVQKALPKPDAKPEKSLKAANDNQAPTSGDQSNKGIYHPHDVRQNLEAKYPGQVSSTTVPNANAKNVKLAGQRHPETGIVFDQRGFPIFDKHVKYDTKLSREVVDTKKSDIHMRAATRDLRENIISGKINKNNFNERQLKAIMAGKDRIPDMTWHHHQDIGRMQLIPRDIHKKTGHIGGIDLWYD